MAQTLKFGKGTWATKTGSSMAYNDQNGNYKPLPFNVERDSIATRVNKEGLIEVVGKDKLRIDYTDSAKGVALLEPSRTNSLLQSNQFDTTWTTSNATVTGGQTGVGGSTDAWLLTKSAVAGAYIAQTISTSGVNTASVYVKEGTLDVITLWCNQVGGSNPFGTFNLTTQTLIDSGTIVGSNITSVGSGWYRVSITFSVNISLLRIYVNNFSDTTEGSIYIQNAQLEQGSYPTSYIPTSGSTYQRQADVVSGSGNSEVFNDSEGVLYVQAKSKYDSSNSRRISLSNGADASSRISFEWDESLENRFRIHQNSGLISYTATNLSLFNKIAYKYKLGDSSLWFNGFKVVTQASSSVPSGINVLKMRGYTNTNSFYGKTKELGYYDTALTDEELEYMTSYRSLNELVTVLNLNKL